MADKKISALTALTSVDIANDTLAIVDNSATETKKVTVDDLTPTVVVTEQASVSTPASGKGVFYFKTDGKPYAKDDTGNEMDITATANPSADQNYQGNYMLNEQGRQDHVSNTMPAPYYMFDGVDDYVNIPDSDDLSFGDGTTDTPFSITARVSMRDATNFWIFSKGISANREYFFGTDGNDAFNFWLFDVDGSNLIKYTSAINSMTAYENKWITVTSTYDGTGNDSGLKFYINGAEFSGTTAEVGTYVAMHNYSQDAIIGAIFVAQTPTSDGEISDVHIYNKALTASEVKQLSSGASVPFKYKGASQTEMITDSDNTNFADGTINEWVVDTDGNGTVTYDGTNPGAEKVGKITVGATAGTYTMAQLPTGNATALEVGKRYRVSARLYSVSGNAFTQVRIQLYDGSQGYGIGTSYHTETDDQWFTASTEFVATGTGNRIRIYTENTQSGDVVYFDDISITQIGAVAEYDASGMSEEHWFDTSGNDLHGDVTGASLENQGDGGATKAITLTPRTLPATADASEGQIVYDSSANKLKVFNGTAWETITSS